jgi:hypothetical protein
MSNVRLSLLLSLAVVMTTLPVFAQSLTKCSDSSEKTLGQMALTLAVSALTSWFTGSMAAKTRLKEFQSKTEILQLMEKKRKEDKNRIQYLNPLRTSTEDLRGRLDEIRSKMKNDTQRSFMLNSFKSINWQKIADPKVFYPWCNIEGCFVMSTLYITSVYFFRANKLRYEFPSAQLDPSQDEDLLRFLSEVRVAFGGEFGIWETIQDSVGRYIRKTDGTLMNYKEFCELIGDNSNHAWFGSLINFYASYNDKLDKEVPAIHSSLNNLIDFLASTQLIETLNANLLQGYAGKLEEIMQRLISFNRTSSLVQRSRVQQGSIHSENSETADGDGQQAADKD